MIGTEDLAIVEVIGVRCARIERGVPPPTEQQLEVFTSARSNGNTEEEEAGQPRHCLWLVAIPRTGDCHADRRERARPPGERQRFQKIGDCGASTGLPSSRSHRCSSRFNTAGLSQPTAWYGSWRRQCRDLPGSSPLLSYPPLIGNLLTPLPDFLDGCLLGGNVRPQVATLPGHVSPSLRWDVHRDELVDIVAHLHNVRVLGERSHGSHHLEDANHRAFKTILWQDLALNLQQQFLLGLDKLRM
mmetsp:Transcript_117780/g.293712  ORF Transcript_117780/g.293712 Transcript_117780/m.293712 type:complete len:244 (+) Transcript_117780:198-929(+)